MLPNPTRLLWAETRHDCIRQVLASPAQSQDVIAFLCELAKKLLALGRIREFE